jgi:hypothetical protein
VANDGLGLIRSFVLPEEHYAALIGHTYNEQEHRWESYGPAEEWKREV